MGIGQSLGLGLLAYGLYSKKVVLVRNDVAVQHVVSSSQQGLMLTGRF